MKTKEDVEKRLLKLRRRYAHKYIQKSQERKHLNCVYNEVHNSTKLRYTHSVDAPLALRNQSTVVVFQNDDNGPVHLCMYDSGDAKEWKGSVCDSDEVSSSCPMFKPRLNLEDAKSEFLDSLADDEYVFNNYRDVATLQWVIGERIHLEPLSITDRIAFFMRSFFIRTPKPVTQLSLPLPEDLWDDSSSNT